jgi:hypothetical protein
MLKKVLKKFGDSEIFTNFAIPKLEQNAPNQLSFNELGTVKEILKTLQQCYSLKEQNSEGNRKTA